MIFYCLENGYVQKNKVTDVDFDYICDVLVVGAGSAGVYAADSAARMGANVIVCEIEKNIGGMSVSGNVNSYYYGLNGGSFVEDDQKSENDCVFLDNRSNWEQRQIRFSERLQKSGVKIMCNCAPIGLFFDQNRVVGLTVFDGRNHLNVKAKITIDATSDGHLIRMTDVKKEYGRSQDGKFVPFTVRTQYVKNQKIYSCNLDSGITNHYDSTDFSQKVILAHAKASALMSQGELLSLAFQTGIREGLTFEGEDTLRYEDVLLGRNPEKVLFWAYSDFDRHGAERATEKELFKTWWVACNLATVTITIPVPLGSVVPKGIKGLVSAGRCLSCDTYTQSAVRMNRDMFRMGECIGVAVAIACRDNVDFLDVDYGEYLQIVKERNCFDGEIPTGFYFDCRYDVYLRKMNALKRQPDAKYSHFSAHDCVREKLDFDFEKNTHLLNTDSPGVAFWSAYVSKDKKSVCQRLNDQMQNAKTDLLRYNCAIALGLLNDKRALDNLRKIIDERDCFFFTDNRRSNQFRSVIAIYLLGLIGSAKDAQLLLTLLDDKEFENPMYHTLKADYLYHAQPDRNFVYFSVITHTCISLYNLYKRHGLPLTQLNGIFKNFFENEKTFKRITKEERGAPAYEETLSFIKRALYVTSEQ